MFGREPRMPVDIVFGVGSGRNEGDRDYPEYAKDMQERLVYVYDLARKNTERAQGMQKAYYDTKVKGISLSPGDKVLVRNLAHAGKHKLADKWHSELYEVLSKPSENVPVYTVRKADGRGRMKTLHRNLLLPVGGIDTEEGGDADKVTKPAAHGVPRRFRGEKRSQREQNSNEVSDSASEDSYSDVCIVPAFRLGGHEVEDGALQAPPVNDLEMASGETGNGADSLEWEAEVISNDPPSAAENDSIISFVGSESSERSVRPQRGTRRPKWMTSGEFVVSQPLRALRNSIRKASTNMKDRLSRLAKKKSRK